MSLSALNHLKSELQRKKEDAEKKKRSIEAHHPTPLLKPEKEDDSSCNESKKLPELTAEEVEKAKKARDILEAKAKLYDSLSEGVHLTKNSNLYLVNFEQKAIEDFSARCSDSGSNSDRIIDLAKDVKEDDDADKRAKPETSCQISSEDQEIGKFSDKELLMKARNLSTSALPQKNESKGTFEPTLVSADMQREKMRQKWEEDENLARSKDDIHYQDVLFDEVRSHGVGYFAFSKDEDERRRQQAELNEMREETLRKQEEFRKMRGDASEESDLNKVADESAGKEELIKELTEEEKLKNIEEALKAIRREVHVREWDKGKEIPVMTQEEWIEKKRNERDGDFAPPEIYFENQSRGKKSRRPTNLHPHKKLFTQKQTLNEKEKSASEDTKKHLEKSEAVNSVSDCSRINPALIPLPDFIVKPMAPVNQDTNSAEMNSNPIKTVTNPKKSAMAFLEQLNNSSTNTEVPSKQVDTSDCLVHTIPLPQSSHVSSPSQLNNPSSSTPSPLQKPIVSPCANPQAKKSFFIPSSLVPKRFMNNSKLKPAEVATSSITNCTASVTSTETAEGTCNKRLSNPFTDPKLSRFLKEPENLEIVNSEDIESSCNEVTESSNDKYLINERESVPSNPDTSSANNEGSRIKLGNLIKNRPAPKSGMALLEEIKKQTRDFGSEDDSSNDKSRASRKRGAEIAPPECLLQSTPQLPVRKKGLFSKKEEISNSISAGLQTLKSVAEKKSKKKREKGLLDIL